MRHLLSEFVKEIHTDEAFLQRANAFNRQLVKGEHDFLKEVVGIYVSLITDDIFSERFLKLSPEERDKLFGAYHGLNAFFEFLLSPNKWMAKK